MNYEIELDIEKLPFIERHKRVINGEEMDCISIPIAPYIYIKDNKNIRMYMSAIETDSDEDENTSHNIIYKMTMKKKELIKRYKLDMPSYLKIGTLKVSDRKWNYIKNQKPKDENLIDILNNL